MGSPKLPNFQFDQIKARIHEQILEDMDLRRMDSLPVDRLRQELQGLTENLIAQNQFGLNETERRQIAQGIQDEMLGLGPIEPCWPMTACPISWSTAPTRCLLSGTARSSRPMSVLKVMCTCCA